ncbi:hypothetical protein XCR_1988 [Xanthomonas campestris pv. raphani 756C]|nr:hypothetical protein XCR_1988 [Xanthomonas campestris pv. raphani 756C]
MQHISPRARLSSAAAGAPTSRARPEQSWLPARWRQHADAMTAEEEDDDAILPANRRQPACARACGNCRAGQP